MNRYTYGHVTEPLGETKMLRFKELLASCTLKHGYWLVTLTLDMKIWIPISRPRPVPSLDVHFGFEAKIS